MSSKLETLEDLFHHQLRDLYSAEKQLMEALPKMAEEASHPDLKKAFEKHLEETKEHKKRLEQVAEKLDIKISGETCEAMKGLIREAKSFISEDATDDVRDAGIITDGQKVEHYEIAGYGSVIEYAKTLGHDEVAKLLHTTLEEEKSADETLTKIAKQEANPHAQ